MEELLRNLAEIEQWIEHSPDPASFRNNNEFMHFMVELMNRSLYLLRVGVSLAPSEKAANQGYSKPKAVIVGHMVRITKLYEGLLMHIAKRQIELAAIFSRLIFETVVRMEYLIKSKSTVKSYRSFLLVSYRPEREILADLSEKAKSRPLIKIEQRMKRKIESRLRRDSIPFTVLMNNKTWDIDGKNFRQMLTELGMSIGYSYIFGSGSHSVHGDWYEIDIHHIEKTGRYYMPKLEYEDPDPRTVCTLTTICLDALLAYLKWNRADPDQVVSPIVSRLGELNRQVDIAHENTLGA